MHAQKAKPGYKLVKSLFEKYKEIPEEWEIKKFDDLFEFLMTGTNSRSDLEESGDIQYIHYGDIHTKWRSVLDCETEEIPWIAKTKVEGLPLLKDGDIIIVDASEDYEGSGASILLKNVIDKKIVSGLHTIALRCKDEKISLDFKAYLTSIKFVKKQIIAYVTGISVYGLSKNNLKKIKIPLPSFLEQQKIGSILLNVDSTINQTQKEIEQTQKLKKGLMQQLLTLGIGHTKFKKVKWYFGKKIEIPEEWEIKKIVDITLKIMKGIFDMSPENYVPKGIPFLRVSDIQNNKLNFSNSVYIRNSTSKEFPSSELYHNDIVLAKVGSIYSNDKIAIIPKDVSKCNISQNIIGIKPDQSKMNSDFLLLELMKNHHIVASFSNVTVQGSLRLEVIRNLKIPVPTLKEQHKIAVTFLNVDSKINDLKSKKSSLEILKKGLMQKLLSGELRVRV